VEEKNETANGGMRNVIGGVSRKKWNNRRMEVLELQNGGSSAARTKWE